MGPTNHNESEMIELITWSQQLNFWPKKCIAPFLTLLFVIMILALHAACICSLTFLAIQLPSTFRAQLTLHVQCEGSSIHPHYHTVVVQTVVGGSQLGCRYLHPLVQTVGR